ncbi:chemotaxis protein CheA [Polynucleobacter sp. UB-Tiil-W10]|uniref:chemotaxis protein CheA n=1 Tax=Polynucleobacter sp. UB-Tiil-W10 TaxID=1855648 RepID=UPI001C0DFF76|nr:chemotaxis protein CheA [Polynucleobacter sp. UB-Tiil-W10]MBU3541548.1 chemotaxis protein CheA [Polynucleobacter sp. UB-Tiil-W10]
MNDDDILIEFIVEAREILDQLDLDFVQLEITPDDKKLVGNIFRAMHTLKGSSGFFAFKRLEKVSHAGESLLGKIRDGQLTLDTQKATILLSALDCLRGIIEGIEATQTEPAGDDSVLVEHLLSLAAGKEVNTSAPVAQVTPSAQPAPTIEPSTISTPAPASEPEPVSQAASSESQANPVKAPVVIGSDDSESTDQVWAPDPADIVKTQESAAPVKVSLELLDRLMNLVSEMVLARNRLLPFTNQFSDHDFSSAVRVVDLLTLELQERMMKTRMQPISQVWTKFPRLMRDVSNQCGKQVTLIQEGSETELDRTLLDAIRDPLVHIIRNSIDHGVEIPEERIRLGKPELGKVLLRASHENGMVVIEIADDGAGVDFDLVRQKAIEKNLVSVQQAQELSDLQLLEFIFLPGFSTKSQVTNLSGRGVGMDVVKTNISNIGGSIDINSKRGAGTNIRLKIPLTLAIMPALFVRCGSEPYAIPQNSVLEMVRLDLSGDSTGLEDFYGTPVFRLRNQLVPILFLNHQLEVSQDLPADDAILNIAILQSSGIRFGLVVDEVLNMQEVVVKPLGPLLKDVKDFAGATILGNGRVALILDIDGIAIQSGMVAKIQSRPLNAESTPERSSDDEVAMLSFELEGQSRLAIYLDNVERLEMISPKQVQRNGNRDVIQYGKEIMHLLYLNHYIEGAEKTKPSTAEDEVIPVIVHYTNGLPVGLVVSQVHDIIHVSKNLHEANPPQKGLIGCVSLNNQVINVIDLQEILMMRNLQENSKEYPAVIDMDFSS